MQTQRQLPPTLTSTEFSVQIARDLIKLASNDEGIEIWLAQHGGSLDVPSRATRRIAYDLFGDSTEACLFNAALVLEVDRQGAAAHRAAKSPWF